jgi:hypothetical protein
MDISAPRYARSRPPVCRDGVTLCSTRRGRGQGRSLANLRAFTNFTKDPLYPKIPSPSHATRRHAYATGIGDYRPVKFTCDVTPRRAPLDNFLAFDCSALSDGDPTQQKSENY